MRWNWFDQNLIAKSTTRLYYDTIGKYICSNTNILLVNIHNIGLNSCGNTKQVHLYMQKVTFQWKIFFNILEKSNFLMCVFFFLSLTVRILNPLWSQRWRIVCIILCGSRQRPVLSTALNTATVKWPIQPRVSQTVTLHAPSRTWPLSHLTKALLLCLDQCSIDSCFYCHFCTSNVKN